MAESSRPKARPGPSAAAKKKSKAPATSGIGGMFVFDTFRSAHLRTALYQTDEPAADAITAPDESAGAPPAANPPRPANPSTPVDDSLGIPGDDYDYQFEYSDDEETEEIAEEVPDGQGGVVVARRLVPRNKPRTSSLFSFQFDTDEPGASPSPSPPPNQAPDEAPAPRPPSMVVAQHNKIHSAPVISFQRPLLQSKNSDGALPQPAPAPAPVTPPVAPSSRLSETGLRRVPQPAPATLAEPNGASLVVSAAAHLATAFPTTVAYTPAAARRSSISNPFVTSSPSTADTSASSQDKARQEFRVVVVGALDKAVEFLASLAKLPPQDLFDHYHQHSHLLLQLNFIVKGATRVKVLCFYVPSVQASQASPISPDEQVQAASLGVKRSDGIIFLDQQDIAAADPGPDENSIFIEKLGAVIRDMYINNSQAAATLKYPVDLFTKLGALPLPAAVVHLGASDQALRSAPQVPTTAAEKWASGQLLHTFRINATPTADTRPALNSSPSSAALTTLTIVSATPRLVSPLYVMRQLLAEMNEVRIRKLTQLFDSKRVEQIRAAAIRTSPNAATPNEPVLPVPGGPERPTDPVLVAVMGLPRSGKTSFISRACIRQDSLPDTMELPMQAIALTSNGGGSNGGPGAMTMAHRDIFFETRPCSLDFIETHSRPSVNKIQFYREINRVNAFVIMYSADSTEDQIKEVMGMVQDVMHAKLNKQVSEADVNAFNVPVVVVCNKCDDTSISAQYIASDLVQQVTNNLQTPHFSVSVLKGNNYSTATQGLYNIIGELCCGIEGAEASMAPRRFGSLAPLPSHMAARAAFVPSLSPPTSPKQSQIPPVSQLTTSPAPDSAASLIQTYMEIEGLIGKMRDPKTGLAIGDQKVLKKTEPYCFTGASAVEWLTKQGDSTPKAIERMQELLDLLVMRRLRGGRKFEPTADSFYRFQMDEDNSSVLNMKKVWIGGVGSASVEITELLHWLFEHLSSYLVQQNDAFVIDTDKIRSSKIYSDFELATAKLQKVVLAHLTQSQRLAFWLNLFNMLSIHVFIQLGHAGKSKNKRKELYAKTHYQIDGLLYSLDDILYGILRANRKKADGKFQFKSGDPRLAQVLGAYDPRIHFVITTMCVGSPSIAVMRPDAATLDSQIALATTTYLNQHTDVKFKEGLVTLPPILGGTFKADFGKDAKAALLFVSKNLQDEEKRKTLNFLVTKIKEKDIKFKPEDVSPSAPAINL